jgi:hypothetical protein
MDLFDDSVGWTWQGFGGNYDKTDRLDYYRYQTWNFIK